jgi:hypothetical protein
VKRTSWIARATLCLMLGSAPSCKPREETECTIRKGRIIRPAGCNGTERCPELDIRQHAHFGGADVHLLGCEEGLHQVALNVSWPVTIGSRHIFEYTGWVIWGYLFPLRGEVVRNLGCSHSCRGFPGPGAEIDLSPENVAWAAPSRDNVFLPLGDGEVFLDHDFRVRTKFEYADDPAATPITVVVEPLAGKAQAYGPLHIGDSFPWGDLRATIVRIIDRFHSFDGWVEVSLSASRSS